MNRAKRTFLPKISLSTLMLLVVVLAIGLASWQMEQAIEKAKAEVYPLRFLANELRVERPDEYVVVGKIPTRINETVYVVHVPDDGGHELCLALADIPDKGLAEVSQRVSISPGIHQVELKVDEISQGSGVHVLLDDQKVMSSDKLESRIVRLGFEGGLRYRTSTHLPADRPLTLLRNLYRPRPNNGPRPGVLLWIERSNSSD